MARAVAARRQGDDFQARVFWLHAASLLDPRSPVLRVAFESGPKGFDDIWIEHDPKRAPPDHAGQPVLRRHIQCKWHTAAGVFGYPLYRGALSDNVWKVLQFLSLDFPTARLQDPANTNNVISDDLSAAERSTIKTAAGRALQANNWNQIVV